MSAVDPTLKMTDGFNLVVDALQMNGVETIYGVVGISITDLARIAQAKGVRYVGFRHEPPAGHAAAAAGFLTQRPGICLTVSAPGFLNGLLALANATTNCFPMIQIADRAIVDLQQGDYQELDQMAIAKQLAKAAFRVERPEEIAVGVARAIRAAVSGRPGGDADRRPTPRGQLIWLLVCHVGVGYRVRLAAGDGVVGGPGRRAR
jgi:oxalyl-CoA decarboxylase